MNFGRIMGDAVLFVFARALRTFDVDLCTLLEIVAHDVDETFAEHRDAVPFRVLAGFTGRTVFPALRSGDAKACDLAIAFAQRSEERRVGKECVSKCRSRWSTDH